MLCAIYDVITNNQNSKNLEQRRRRWSIGTNFTLEENSDDLLLRLNFKLYFYKARPYGEESNWNFLKYIWLTHIKGDVKVYLVSFVVTYISIFIARNLYSYRIYNMVHFIFNLSHIKVWQNEVTKISNGAFGRFQDTLCWILSRFSLMLKYVFCITVSMKKTIRI